MHVPQFLSAFQLIVYVEIVITRLPEWVFALLNGYRQLQGLNCFGQDSNSGLADKQMNVFRHDDVTANDKIVPDTHGLKGVLEEPASG